MSPWEVRRSAKDEEIHALVVTPTHGVANRNSNELQRSAAALGGTKHARAKIVGLQQEVLQCLSAFRPLIGPSLFGMSATRDVWQFTSCRRTYVMRVHRLLALRVQSETLTQLICLGSCANPHCCSLGVKRIASPGHYS
jgi:hypothetical protein